jgi:hypothetical protein
VVFAYVILNALSSILRDVFECQPVRYAWEGPAGLPGECVDISTMELTSGIIIALADLMLLVLPIPVILSLHISRKDKIMLCGIFTLGSA